jgi:2-dehydro-3-deoxyphosphogluconate aldolase/(4S)-4-hydroxy-2-oxoglutarate aldolase
MSKSDTLGRITDVGVVPVVRAESGDEALAAVEAVSAGGIPVVEITMTVPGAVRVIEDVAARSDSGILVGAGSVLDAETARACILAGARFVVCPVVDLATIEICRRYGTVVIPGALTPTEILAAWQAGADLVKVFPCDSAGGPRHIRSVRAPLPQVRLMPTGGVTLDTAADYLSAGAVALGVGSDLVDLKALREGRGASISERARAYSELLRASRRPA